MSSYNFEAVEISAFDVHIVARPLTSPEFLQKDFQFLADPDLYRNQFHIGQSVKTLTLQTCGLQQWIRESNHFWKRYSDIWHSVSTADLWKLQLPFVCRPLSTKIEIEIGGVAMPVRVTIFLFAIGWATAIDFSLTGSLSPPELRDVVGRMRAKPAAGNPSIFLLDGHPYRLADVLRIFGDRIKTEIYIPKAAIGESMKVARHLIIVPQRFSGPLNYFMPRLESDSAMPTADRAMMFSLLRGEEITEDDFLKIAADHRFSIIDFPNRGPDFAITEFQTGTLFCPQRAAQKNVNPPKSLTRLHCASANLRASCLMILMLTNFCQDDEAIQLGKKSGKVGTLLDGVKATLKAFPSKYANEVCRGFFRCFGPLKKLFLNSSEQA
jgi:hypothetical protein